MPLDQLKRAIEQLEAEIAELKNHLPAWNSKNTSGTKTYRPIARRIVLSAQRVQELVRENTYSP
ncbi:MAG: hypothetical protein LAO04_16865 [Acidobacteriia bacterium]|jgi:hypothetical protein|nr:hypothetical protein [Terriglobia bacterium]